MKAMRIRMTWYKDDHDDDHDGHEDEHEGHDDDHNDAHAHAHGEFDAHIWLDPVNAKKWS